MDYNRMNPDIKKFLHRMEEYAKIDYGTKAYELSVREADLINKLVADNKYLINMIYKYAGRATKDGAKNLVNEAYRVERMYET